MQINALTEEYENVTVLGHPMLFTCSRIDRDTVPGGLYAYDVRHDDDQQGVPCELAKYVLVNHWGTVITDEPVELKENYHNAYHPLTEDDWNYEGTTSTLEEYLGRKKA